MHNKFVWLTTILLTLCVGVSAQSPRVVARMVLNDQTGAIGPITLYTPTVSGVFRVNTFILTTVAGANSLTPIISFTDEAGPSQVSACAGCLLVMDSRGNAWTGVVAVYDETGYPLTFSTALSGGGTPTAKYDVIVIVEKM
jgi:hypothetical protein